MSGLPGDRFRFSVLDFRGDLSALPTFVSIRVIRGQKSEFWVPDPATATSVPIRAIRGQSAVGSNGRNLADPEISVH